MREVVGSNPGRLKTLTFKSDIYCCFLPWHSALRGKEKDNVTECDIKVTVLTLESCPEYALLQVDTRLDMAFDVARV